MEEGSIFTSIKEKTLWSFSLTIFIAIFSGLIIGNPLLEILNDQHIRAGVFLLGMILTGICILLYGIITKPKIIQLILVLAIITVYILFFLRLGLPERTHLIEYGLLSLSIHQALSERQNQGKKVPYLNIWTIIVSCSIGVIDEVLQLLFPNRVFDFNDILFNCIAVFIAIGTIKILHILKKNITS